MKDRVEQCVSPFRRQRFADVVAQELVSRLPVEPAGGCVGGQVVDAQHFGAPLEQCATQVSTEEAATAGHQHTRQLVRRRAVGLGPGT